MGTGRAQFAAVVSTKGQIILPKPIRDARRWPPGTRLSVESTAEGVLLRPLAAFSATSVDEVFGLLRGDTPTLSLDDMDAAIAAEARRPARD